MWCVYINRSSQDHRFSFSDLLKLQNQVLSECLPHGRQALIFAEVTPTVTLGSRQVHSASEPVRGLTQLNVDVLPGERGGNETWHGPGQWIGFVISPLETFTGDSKGVRKAVYSILEKLLPVVSSYRKDAHLEEGDRLGIWSRDGKIVSVGIKVRSRYITSGFALNVIPKAESFLGINPCGISGAKPAFLLDNDLTAAQAEREFMQLPAKILKNW